MLDHETFARSGRLSRFLEFVVETSLGGNASQLKEYTVAVSAFEKDDSFDPRTDPIVRVEAGRLRSRLDEYYRSNPSDPVVIQLPKGSYRPVIRWTRAAPGASIALDAEPAASSGPEAARGKQSTPSTIVVLPFRDLSGDHRQEYLCEAITERITGVLARLGGIRTVAHTSALQFSGSPLDVRRIGRELEVDLVLEGSVQRSGRRIRVNAGVCRTADGLQIWGNTYDRQLKDVLALQDDVSEAIASNLLAMVGIAGTGH